MSITDDDRLIAIFRERMQIAGCGTFTIGVSVPVLRAAIKEWRKEAALTPYAHVDDPAHTPEQAVDGPGVPGWEQQ